MSQSDPDTQTWRLSFTLNGERREMDVDPQMTLLQLLRMELGLMGTKGACEEGECGSCTVILDGMPVNSCLVMAAQVQDREVHDHRGAGRGRQPAHPAAQVHRVRARCSAATARRA